jgi:F0F1-type ATP synthase assembly protein I
MLTVGSLLPVGTPLGLIDGEILGLTVGSLLLDRLPVGTPLERIDGEILGLTVGSLLETQDKNDFTAADDKSSDKEEA